MYSSLLDEIIYLFLTETPKPKWSSFKNFLDFSEKRCSQNLMFKLTFDFVFEVLHPLHVFRSSIRKGNDKAAFLSRDYACRILYGSSHPRYHSILAYHVSYILSLSQAQRDIVVKESCVTEKSQIGQPFDFLVEEANRRQKAYLPADGAPTIR